MSEIIERAAKALEELDVSIPQEKRMNDYDAMARAVLIAIRKPNISQRSLGAYIISQMRHAQPLEVAEHVFIAMIDEALNH